VTVGENPNPPKKVKSKTTVTSTLAWPESTGTSGMLDADFVSRPKMGGSQWRNTDLPPMMVEDSSWRRRFIPTVLLWAGSQPDFWSIEPADLLGALQAIFQVLYPGVNHIIQPKGPIMGVVSPRIIFSLYLSEPFWRKHIGGGKALASARALRR